MSTAPSRPPRSSRRATPALLALLALLEAYGGSVRAEEESEASEPSTLESVSTLVDDTQRRASERFTDFISSVDEFFGTGEGAGPVNESWARIRVQAAKPGDEDASFDATVKLRIVLPQAEQRFRLLISSEEEESIASSAEIERPRQLDAGEEGDVSLALRFVRTARDTGSVNFDVGTRQRDGVIQLFGRINTTFEGETFTGWLGRASNSYYYYSTSGFDNRLRFELRRPVAREGTVFFRTSTGFDWRKGRKGASIGETLGVYADIDERRAVALEALAGYTTALNGDQSKRYRGAELRVRWRHGVWRPWFFYEIWPSVVWPSSNGYEQVYGLLLRVEAIIGRRR